MLGKYLKPPVVGYYWCKPNYDSLTICNVSHVPDERFNGYNLDVFGYYEGTMGIDDIEYFIGPLEQPDPDSYNLNT